MVVAGVQCRGCFQARLSPQRGSCCGDGQSGPALPEKPETVWERESDLCSTLQRLRGNAKTCSLPSFAVRWGWGSPGGIWSGVRALVYDRSPRLACHCQSGRGPNTNVSLCLRRARRGVGPFESDQPPRQRWPRAGLASAPGTGRGLPGAHRLREPGGLAPLLASCCPEKRGSGRDVALPQPPPISPKIKS